jgi:hypothetical protein
MFETLRRHPLLVLNQAARDPLDTLAGLRDSFYSRIESANTIGDIADPDWEAALNSHLGISPESEGERFGRYGLPSWRRYKPRACRSARSASTNGTTEMRDSSGSSLVRHLRPVSVVETGVAHGMTSRFILEALETVGAGKLWSIDLPPLSPMTRQEVGVAVRQNRRAGRSVDIYSRHQPAPATSTAVTPPPDRSVHSRQHAQQP